MGQGSSSDFHRPSLAWFDNQLATRLADLPSADISELALTDAHVLQLTDALSTLPNPKLRELILQSNRIGSSGGIRLARLLDQNVTLSSLCLRYNAIGAEAALAFAEALENNCSLETLDLSGNDIGDAAAARLVQSLKRNKRLHTLALASTQLTKVGVASFQGALVANTTLTSLDLSANPLTDQGALSIFSALNYNSSLASLSLTATGLTDRPMKLISKSLILNSTLTSLSLAANAITDPSFADLIEASLINDTIRYLELPYSNPELRRATSEDRRRWMLEFRRRERERLIRRKLAQLELTESIQQALLQRAGSDIRMLTKDVLMELGLNKKMAKMVLQELNSLGPARPLIQNFRCPIIPESLITINHRLGAGASATVHSGTFSGSPAAFKIFNESYIESDEQRLVQEAEMWHTIIHPHIVPFFGLCIMGNSHYSYCIVMELCDTSLRERLDQICDSKIPPFDEQRKLTFAIQLVSALSFLHSKQLLHRDIKAANCLIVRETLKLSDLGSMKARIATDGKTAQQGSIAGTWGFIPKEILVKPYAPLKLSSDIYSLGVTFVELLNPFYAFPPPPGKATYQQQLEYAQSIPPPTVELTSTGKVDELIGRLAQKCLSEKANERPTAEHIYDTLQAFSEAWSSGGGGGGAASSNS